jgi:enamine deaminase RidA (YjgF/YER057c/UK114 family)
MPDRDASCDHGGRRDFVGKALLGIAGGAVIAAGTADAAQTENARIKGLYPDGAPAADIGYSPGILAEGKRVVFVSGQGPKDMKADMETQFRQTFERIGAVLAAGGASFQDVVMLRAYFVHLARDLPVYRKVRREFLARPYPASTAVGVTELASPDLMIEVEAVAIVG